MMSFPEILGILLVVLLAVGLVGAFAELLIRIVRGEFLNRKDDE